jgi:dCTP deaminase
MILNDNAIRQLSRAGYCGVMRIENYEESTIPLIVGSGCMIEPFSEGVSEPGVISYGLTSGGYDLRLSEEMYEYTEMSYKMSKGWYGVPEKVYTEQTPIDPFRFSRGDEEEREEYKSLVLQRSAICREANKEGITKYGKEFFLLPPGAYVLGRSVEYLRIPRRIVGTCVGKSTYARCGVCINTTPLEPEWEGHLTIEIANLAPRPVKIYIGQGIAQLRFEILIDNPEKSYADKKGIYQNQVGVTVPRVRG